MDIEKEKIAHEKHLLSQGVDFKYLPNIQYNELENIYELIEWDEEYSEALNEINSSWCTWQAAKAHEAEKLKGCVVVPKGQTEDWYLDPDEYMWFDHDGIDSTLCDMNIGEVTAIEHKEYLITKSDTLYAAIVWDDENQDSGTWEFFKTEEEAEKAAAHCKAMLEAARGGNE
ncbi:hypothetical protein [Acinetobacter haemolyticus]|uniref:hypothetical protein n=1 Tax=Acinetobacter haemolyticus TaxID=29430 RepID=UPI0020919638|nr:hypothetical protein [Acinetobacter haemolyticus]